MLKQLFLLAILSSITFCMSCSDDESTDPADPCDDITSTYDGSVKAIVDASCAYAGCHDGTGANAFIPAGSNDFTTYAGLKASLDSGVFNTRALVTKDMPPVAFVPAGFPTELTDVQIETLTCWMSDGYPEN